jgi:Ser/Thr protein kinase RdoA (MazF antagonist)
MKEFSVIISTISTKDIAAFVCEKYALSPNTTCRLLKTGINHTYKINSNSDSFIFRIYSYNWRTKDEINEELNLLKLLKRNQISISYPLADSEENYIQSIRAPEGVRFGVLFSYAEGQKVANFNKEMDFEIGKLMAQIHKLTKNFQQKRIAYTPQVLLSESLQNIRQYLSDDTEEMQFLMRTRPVLEKILSDADSTMLRKGIVHLDIWFDNLNISDEGKITLFDFDFCGNGWLCLDIAYYIMQLHNTEKDEIIRFEKIEAFYRGYESIEEISDQEKELIPFLGVCLFYFYLGVICNRFENWSNTFVNEVYLHRYVAVYIKSNYEKIQNSKS